MEFIKPGTYIDFMRHRKVVAFVSIVATLIAIGSVFYPGPNYGIDFTGGTEVQLRFRGRVDSGELRNALERLGYRRPDVVAVEGSRNEYLVRVQEVSSLPPRTVARIKSELRSMLNANAIQEFKVSPGGDKISMRLSEDADPKAIATALTSAGAQVREVSPFGQAGDHRYEAYLVGIGDQLVEKLQRTFKERAPEAPRRIGWVGPKAGEQLRTAAIKALLYALAFIMVYVAFRFDLRFAPGGVIALVHDLIITAGVFVLLQKEVNLTLVAAMLTVVGYSIDDTIVVYDRIRENMGRLRDKSLSEIINISTSEMLSRTIVTSGVTLLSVSAFFIWGTDVIKDLAFALFIGIAVGTYSSIYVAAPITEFIDAKFFRKRRRA